MNGARARILHIGKFYSPYRGGIETHLQLLCGELRKQLDLRVVVASNDRSSHDEIVAGVHVKRASTWANVAGAPVCPEMIREIRTSQADIVHMHLPNPGAILAYLASGHKGILICSYHSDIVRQRFLGTAFEPILRRMLLRSSAVVVSSPNYIDSSPVLASMRQRCRVIPYGISLEPFDASEPAATSEIRKRYGWPLILAVGRLVYYKGFRNLIRAMRKVPGKLLLVGDGPLRADLNSEVRKLGLSDRVVFLGDVETLTPFYHSAELLVLPSNARSEAFGIVQLEAMACRKPVINTSLDTGVPFASVHGVTGLTVPPDNADALADAINLLLENTNLRAEYGAAGRVRVEQLFTLELMTERMLRLYAEVRNGFDRKAACHEE